MTISRNLSIFADAVGVSGSNASSITVPTHNSTTSLTFQTNGTTTAMTIDTSQNVGIGTASPSQILHVSKSTTAATHVFTSNSQAAVYYGIDVNGTGYAWQSTGPANSYFYLGTSVATGTTLLYAGGSERMRIDSSGRVGIGTSSPAFALDVAGNNGAAIRGGNGFNFYNSDNTNNMYIYNSGATGAGNGNMLFFSGGVGERMRIDSSGNVGIGTSSPASLSGYTILTLDKTSGAGMLQINASGTQIGRIYTTSSQLRIEPVSTSPVVFLQNTGTELMRIDTSGNVGIGTSSPGQKLDVVGAVRSKTGTGGTVNMDSTAAGTANTIGSYANNGAAFADLNYSGNNHIWLAGGTEYMRLTSSGNVGIGTSSPSLTLNVKSPSDYRVALFQTASTLGPSVQIQGSRIYELRSTDTGASEGAGLFFIYDKTAGASRVTVDSSGNVGIGTTSPSTNFVLSSGTGPVGGDNTGYMQIAYTGTNTTTNSAVTVKNYQGTSQFMQWDINGLRFGSRIKTNTGLGQVIFTYGNDSEAMRIDSSGNLLVGTTSSNGRLAVDGAGNTSATYAVYVRNSTPNDLLYLRNDGFFSTGNAGSSPYNATTATAANVVVASNGQLQRSTSSLRYKENVKDSTHGLADVMKLRSVTYNGKNDGDKVFGGFIAEEVDAAGLNEFVAYDEEGRPDALHYGNMVALMAKAIQELSAELTALKAKVGA